MNKYFLNKETNIVHVFFDYQKNYSEFINDSYTEITKEEADLIVNPTLSQEEFEAQKESENIAFLASEKSRTNDAIEVLDDAIEFEEETIEEVAQNKSLRKYRLDLSRVPNQETWPLNPTWPTCPEFFKTKE